MLSTVDAAMNTALMRRNKEETKLFDDFIISDHILWEYRGHDTQVSIPRGVKGIGERAFAHNDTVTSIEISDTVTFIGKGAFAYCKNLRSINIP